MVDIQTLVFSCVGAESTGRAVPLGERPGQLLAQEQELSCAALQAEEFYLKEVTWPVQGYQSCPTVHNPDLTVGSAQHRQLWRRVLAGKLGQE